MPKFQVKTCSILLLSATAIGLGFAGCSPTPEDEASSASSGQTRRGNGSTGIMQPMAMDASGSEIFQQKCQRCHGANGEGKNGPNLIKLSETDAQLVTIVHDGQDNMPSFAQELSDAQISSVIAHLRTLPVK